MKFRFFKYENDECYFYVTDATDNHRFCSINFYPCRLYCGDYGWKLDKAYIERAQYVDKYNVNYNSVITEIDKRMDKSYQRHLEKDYTLEKYLDGEEVIEIDPSDFKNLINEIAKPTEASLSTFWSNYESLSDRLAQMTDIQTQINQLTDKQS